MKRKFAISPRFVQDDSWSEQQVKELFGYLARIINGEHKFVSFEACYRCVYNLILHKKADQLTKKLRFIYTAVACLPTAKYDLSVLMLRDILMVYNKHIRINRGQPSVVDMARTARDQREAWAAATIDRILGHVFFLPGGVFERNRQRDWVDRAKEKVTAPQ